MTERATKPAEEPAGAARTTKVAGEEGSRVPAGPRPAPSGLAPGQVLAFQRSVGNAAVAGSLTRSRPPSRPAPARVGKPAGNAAQAFLQRQAPGQGGSGGSGLAEGAASEAGAGPAVLEERAGPDAEVPSARLQREAAPAQPPGAAGGGVGGAGQGAEGGSWWQQLREFGDLAARLGGKASEVWDKLGPFTDTLWAGVKGGFSGFVTHFSEHFQTQFQGWFANTMGAAGFQAPETWDLHGFFTMVFSVLGINLDSVQSRFAEIDQEGIDGVPELKALHEKGPIALVDLAEGELNTIQEEVVEDVKSNLVTSLVTQGVEFLIGMLAPAAGGVMALVRILRYFWDNRQSFKDLGNRLVSSVDSILGGKVDAVAQVVEGSLAATIPLVLSLFEHLLKLDKLAEKVAGIIGKVRGSITGLIDKVVGRAKEAGRRLMGGRRGAGKGTPASRPTETTHASEAAKPAAGASGAGNETKAGAEADKPTQDKSMAEKERIVHTAVDEGTALANGPNKSQDLIKRGLDAIRGKYALKTLELVDDGPASGAKEKMHVRGTLNPTYDGRGFVKDKEPPDKVVIDAEIGPPAKRQGFENVLEPGKDIGLPGWERAHLAPAGLGIESPLGIYYAPREVNQVLQNKGIEQALRQSYAKRFPGAQLFVKLQAEPHPGTKQLKKVVYELSGMFPGKPKTVICELVINISDDPVKPEVKPRLGYVDEEAIGLYTSALTKMIDSIKD